MNARRLLFTLTLAGAILFPAAPAAAPAPDGACIARVDLVKVEVVDDTDGSPDAWSLTSTATAPVPGPDVPVGFTGDTGAVINLAVLIVDFGAPIVDGTVPVSIDATAIELDTDRNPNDTGMGTGSADVTCPPKPSSHDLTVTVDVKDPDDANETGKLKATYRIQTKRLPICEDGQGPRRGEGRGGGVHDPDTIQCEMLEMHLHGHQPPGVPVDPGRGDPPPRP